MDAAAGSPQSLYSPLSFAILVLLWLLQGGAGWVLLICGFPLPLPFLSLLPYHSACLSLSLFSRKAETFLQLSGFFPWRISLIAPPDWVSLAGWWHWLYSISILLPSWENVPFIPPFCLLFLLQLFYSFSGILKKKKKSKLKAQNFLLSLVVGSFLVLLCIKLFCFVYPKEFLKVPSDISGDSHSLLPNLPLPTITMKITRAGIYYTYNWQDVFA